MPRSQTASNALEASRTTAGRQCDPGVTTHRTCVLEQALRTNLGGTEVMRGQLTHLLDALERPGLKLGVIPARAELALYPGHSFTIFDGRHVQVETFSAGLDVKDEREVAVYEKAFALLERSAVYGREARELVEAELAVLT
ncbi:Scr1 family TA system antitoxin-like transcriptional regulator [Streptomyces sp. NPDC002143]